MSACELLDLEAEETKIISVVDIFITLCAELEEVQQQIIRKMAENAAETVDFTKPWEYSDIKFIVEDKPVYANKMIISMWSPVFAAMFRNNFKEKDAAEIQLPEKNYDDVVEMMRVLHPPNKEICGDNVVHILSLAQEYQMDHITERCEDFLLSQAPCIKNYHTALKFNLKKLEESNMSYLRRAPISRLRNQEEFDIFDKEKLVEILMEKCDKFETNIESLREIRMVLERKKPTTFPGMHMLCESCTSAREQQVDCSDCMRSCCRKMVDVIRSIDR